MIRNICVALAMFAVVISADEKASKYTQVIHPASRQIPTGNDGYQSDALYPQPTGPYQMAYQASNEAPYPPASEEASADTQAHQPEQLQNPAYDPNLYQTFVPQDNVQQYVSSYGGPYAPGPNAVGYPAAYPGPYGPGGFALQTGYEGYLFPQVPAPPPPPPGLLDIFRSTLPYSTTVTSMLMRSGTYLLSSIGVILFGGAVTTAICSFTPLCTITFAALPFLGLRESLTTKTIKEAVANEITSDRVRRAAEFVRTALEKYNQIQDDISKESKSDSASDAAAKKVTETKSKRRRR